jgi:hypothetical protein
MGVPRAIFGGGATRSQVIVVVTPSLDGFARLGEREEDVLVEAFAALKRQETQTPEEGQTTGGLYL